MIMIHMIHDKMRHISFYIFYKFHVNNTKKYTIICHNYAVIVKFIVVALILKI